MNIVFAMVEPARPANVGAAARALKTMGFAQLAIINSNAHRTDEARWVAHGATEILDNALELPDLAALRAQCSLLIASTARERGTTRHYHTPEALRAQLVQQQHTAGTVAIVFGREASGLSNDELAQCELWSTVPLAQDYPSLNLGQAVMVYAYALSALAPQLGLQDNAADAGQLQHMLQRVRALLDSQMTDCDPKLREWLDERLPLLSDRDVKLAHQLLNRWQRGNPA